jgi:hypothetical protein
MVTRRTLRGPRIRHAMSVVAALVVLSASAAPFAQNGGGATAMAMTCAEFMAMSSDDRMMVVEKMWTAGREMAINEMMPDDMASDKMTSQRDAPTIDVATVLRACEGKPSEMVMDVMMEASGD